MTDALDEQNVREITDYWERLLDYPPPPAGPQLVLAGDIVVRRKDVRTVLAAIASADTHPKDGDATEIAAPLVSGAVPKADAQTSSDSSQ